MKLSIKNKIFILYAAVIILSVVSIGYMGFKSTTNSYIDASLNLSKNESETLAVNIEENLASIPNDMSYLVNFHALNRYIIWESIGEKSKIKKWEDHYSHAFIDFMRRKEIYYKIRMIDNDGLEKFTFVYDKKSKKVVKLKEENLQKKSSRNYFQKSKNLKRGEFYISPIELNEEHGQVVEPYIPVIRYITPVVDDNGQKHGIFVCSVYINEFLTIFDSFENKKQSQSNYFLIEQDGSYIYNKNSSKLWSKQLNRNENFKNDFPLVLNEFKKDSGAFIQDENIFSYKRIHPFEGEEKLKDNFFYIVSEIKTDYALKGLESFKRNFIIITLLILILGYIVVTQYLNKLILPLKEVSKQLEKLSKGETQDNVIEYKSHDEIGELVNSSKILTHSMQMNILQAQAVSNGDFSQKIELLGENDKLGIAIRNMTNRLSEVSSLATKLSNGNYDVQIVSKSNEDKLAHALIKMVAYLRNITEISESISLGNLNVKYKIKSEQDRLGYSLLAMISYLKNIDLQATAISNDDLTQKINPKSENDDLGKSLLLMTEKLKTNMEKNKNDIWFSEGINEFVSNLRNYETIEEILNQSISKIAQYIDASCALLYRFDKEEKIFKLESSYAFVHNKDMESFTLGSGIIGQSAMNKKPILLENLQNEHYKIQSGLHSQIPKQTYSVPLIKDDEVLGVIELATINVFTPLQKEYIMRISEILANMFYDALQNMQIKVLLDKSQCAYEELQTSSEELQVSNEQMEEQAAMLEEQAKNLKEQNGKLEKAKIQLDLKAEELLKSSEYKSEFMSNMSHELRTPLNSILLLSSLLEDNKKQNLNSGDLEKARVIHQSGNELLRLINDLLDLSKIEAGKMELIIDEINSQDLLLNNRVGFEELASKKAIDFIVNDDYQDIFYNDQDRLSQVIRNLISNAFKFTKKGSVTLEISNSNEPDLPIRISVIDTGVGIDKTKQKLIFKAFMQADGSTSREYGGTGLGLSISKELTHLMKGKITIESVENEGSIFNILLPNLINDFNSNNANSQNNVKILKKEKAKIVINNEDILNQEVENILIIEDDETFVNILSDSIKSNKMNPLVAFNAKDGLSLARSEKISGIIIDLGLPDMDGFELINKFKNDDSTKNIPIQIISGIDKKELDLELLETIDFLQKPVTLKQINNVLHSLQEKSNHSIKSVLIVEDNLTHQEAINTFLLNDRDINITNCSTVDNAIYNLKNKNFDLAIIDLKLTDGSGNEICNYIKSNNINTATLIYTSRELTEKESDYLKSISDEIIIKNLNSEKRLKDEVGRFLNNNYKHNTAVEIKVNKKDSDYSISDMNNLEAKKVLIVDDDIKNIFVLSTALQESNMQTMHAKNGKEALEVLRNNDDIDIVLMDIMMPVMNGYEAMKAIRIDDKLKKLPVIAVTAKAMSKDKEKAMQSGADDYLSKPIDLKKLKTMISMWLNKNK